MPRIARNATARNLQSRGAEARPSPQVEERSVLWYDDRKRPKGYTYGWVRRAVLNQEDALNMLERQRQGWKPVPSARHGELATGGWEDILGNTKSYIEVAGLVLCECPTADLKRRAELQRQMAMDALRMPHFEGDSRAKDLPGQDFGSQTGFERVVTQKVENEAEFKE